MRLSAPAPPPRATQSHGAAVPPLASPTSLGFREELPAIEAAIAGQGAGICSDVLVASELGDGRLIRLSDVGLPGYRFFLARRPDHPRLALIAAFERWLRTTMGRGPRPRAASHPTGGA